MKRLLIALLLLLAVFSLAVAQNTPARKTTHHAPPKAMQGVSIRKNVIRFSSAWQIVKGSDNQTYARKKKVPTVVLAVGCSCAQEGPSGTCFLQSVPGHADELRCNKAPNCTGVCGVKTNWVEPKDIPTLGLP